MRLNRAWLLLMGCLLLRWGEASDYHLPASETELQLIFGDLWRHVEHLQQHGQLEPYIALRKQEIASIKAHWKEKLATHPPSSFTQEVDKLLEEGSLIQASTGRGCAYLLTDETGAIAFLLKPFDEELFCLNHSKGAASPFFDETFRVRRSIPLYRSMLAEVLAYRFASILDLSDLVPETHLGIVSHTAFYEIDDRFPSTVCDAVRPCREKLCSIQRYLPCAASLHCCVESWIENQWTEQDVLDALSHEAIENLFLLIWLLYDTDAHAGNIAAVEGPDAQLYLVKVDNGLTFPEKNERLLNALRFFPHAHFPLSDDLSDRILNLPMTELVSAMHEMEMEAACPAFLERVTVLQTLVQDPTRTLAEIDLRMRALALPSGAEVAVENLKLEDLEEMVSSEGAL